ncbi:hypothetical protein MPSEU_000166200 [Mayamaea pseudoterrestris]|nr:hypothetical protein MPSEU_000166200 [Mayamaea pseudoterrestris]
MTLRLVIFDLDHTIWRPEMCDLTAAPQLKPAPSNLSPTALKEGRTIKEGHFLMIGEDACMQVFEGASIALSEINRWKREGRNIQAAAASKSDVPNWARICLDYLVVDDGTVLAECFPDELVELYKANKEEHLQRLQEKTGVAYSDMAFFDDERHKNIVRIENELPHVKTYYVPHGMTREAWEEAKTEFGMK